MSKSEDFHDTRTRMMESRWSEEATDEFISDLLLRFGSVPNALYFAKKYLRAVARMDVTKGEKRDLEACADKLAQELAIRQKAKEEPQ